MKVGWAVLAYNQPILAASPRRKGDGETLGETMMKALTLGFERVPHLQARFDQMLALRTSRFAHLFRPILAAKASFGDEGDIQVGVTLARRELCDPVATRS